jgi:hypothetical protein
MAVVRRFVSHADIVGPFSTVLCPDVFYTYQARVTLPASWIAIALSFTTGAFAGTIV